VALKVVVNLHDAGVMWHNYKEVNIREFIVSGKNEVCFEVFGHCSNSQGFLYFSKKDPDFISTEHFSTKGKRSGLMIMSWFLVS